MRRGFGERGKKECGICDARSPSQGPTLRVWRTPTFLDRLPERRSAPPPGNRTAQLGRSGLEAFGLSRLRRRLASKAEARRVAHGAEISAPSGVSLTGTHVAALDPEGGLLAVLELRANRALRPLRVVGLWPRVAPNNPLC